MAEGNAVPEQTGALCCGGPAPKDSDACCAQDAEAKAAGEAGCGCSVTPASCCG